MTPEQKAAARDQIAALKLQCCQVFAASNGDYERALATYVLALEGVCDELTRPEQEDLTRDRRDECIVCHCALVTDDAPPHCLDCVPTDEHLEAWESRLKPKGEAK